MKNSKRKSTPSPGNFLRDLNHVVFWPPFLLLLAVVVLNFTSQEKFSELTNGARDWILVNFGWLFTVCAFAAVLLCIYICFSKFGDVKIGGQKAEPLMSKWNWFSITICTTIAAGILFWATAEPIYHYHNPSAGSGVEAETPEAAVFAMSAMYLHWTFTPYAIYAVVSLTFAFSYYNMKQPFSLGATMAPLIGAGRAKAAGGLIDAVCLYALVAGMAAALGAGIMAIGGGLNSLFGVPSNLWTWGVVAIIIVVSFIVSSATGLMNGIRILSDINVKALMGLALVGFLFGPTLFILNLGLESFGVYLSDFFQLNLYNGILLEKETVEQSIVDGSPVGYWSHSWTVFYWAVWIAWAPISACFLGRIAYGRTVKEFMMINFILPAIFGLAWMGVFSGTALFMEMNGDSPLLAILNDKSAEGGAEFVTYEVFKTFPLSVLVIGFYVISLFICFVTSADSNTSAMSAISSTGISPENPEGNVVVKVAWGVTVGVVAWVMISFAGGVEGIKIISTLGGFPAALLFLVVIGSLIRIVLNHEKMNVVDR
jgi:choline-glycine betaine transporter